MPNLKSPDVAMADAIERARVASEWGTPKVGFDTGVDVAAAEGLRVERAEAEQRAKEEAYRASGIVGAATLGGIAYGAISHSPSAHLRMRAFDAAMGAYYSKGGFTEPAEIVAAAKLFESYLKGEAS